jgi:hypothetical protein
MSKSKKVLFLSLILIFGIIVFVIAQAGKTIYPYYSGKTALPHTTLRIDLNQDSSNRLSISKVTKENENPLKYQLNISKNFLLVKILSADTVLFTGKILQKQTIIYDVLADTVTGGETESSFSQIKIYLPYFYNARLVTLSDSKDRTLLVTLLDALNLSNN